MRSAGLITSAQMGSACPLSSRLKVLGTKAAEHLKWVPKKRSNPYLSVLKLTKTCWRAERHSSPVTPAARDSESKRKHTSSWSLCRCAWWWWVGPCFDRVLIPWEEVIEHPEMNFWPHLNWEENLWPNHILHQLFSVLLNLHCIILSINIYSYSEWPCSSCLHLKWEKTPWNPWNYI